MRNKIFLESQSTPTICPEIPLIRKERKSNFTMEKPDRQQLNQVNITNMGQIKITFYLTGYNENTVSFPCNSC